MNLYKINGVIVFIERRKRKAFPRKNSAVEQKH